MSLADIRTLQLSANIRARIVAQLQAAGLPVNDWTPSAAGGVENLVLDSAAKTLARLIAPKVVMLGEMRFLDLATGDALTIYARKRYKLERNLAAYAIQNCAVSSVQSAPYYKFRGGTSGDLIVRGAGGNLFRNIDPVELKPGDTVMARFQADQPGASYNDATGTITQMVTAPAGVSAVNVAASDFEPTTVTGPSSGTITPLTGVGRYAVAAPTVSSVRVKITVSGEVGGGYCKYSIDGGATWIEIGPIPELLNLPGAAPGSVGGILHFQNGTPPSFVAGDIFTLLVSDALIQRGADEESDESLRQRCRYRWASLSDVPVEGLVSLWCQLASPEVHRVRIDADANSPGGMLITIASQGGPASPAAIIAVSDFVTARLNGYRGMSPPSTGIGNSPEEFAHVSTARRFEITPSGTVQVPRSRIRETQELADKRWAEHLGRLDIGATVVFDEIIEAIMGAGATDVSEPDPNDVGEPDPAKKKRRVSLKLNGAAANIQLAGDQVAVSPDGVTLTNTLVWQAV